MNVILIILICVILLICYFCLVNQQQEHIDLPFTDFNQNKLNKLQHTIQTLIKLKTDKEEQVRKNDEIFTEGRDNVDNALYEMERNNIIKQTPQLIQAIQRQNQIEKQNKKIRLELKDIETRLIEAQNELLNITT
jgi:hypothetical protein